MPLAPAALRLLAPLALILASSASCTGPSPATPGTAEPTATPTDAPSAIASTSAVAAPAGPPKFEVHEWGLIDVVGSTGRVLAGPHGPKPQSPPRPVRKPVLYFHLTGGTTSVDVTTKITVGQPGVLEYFPTTGELTNNRKTLTWPNLHVRKGACHYQLPRNLGCNASDGCETPELPNYETDDSACIESGKDAFNLLFYRGAVSGKLELPFDIADDGKALTITHARGADFVGPIVYVHNEAGELRMSVLSPPDMGKAIVATPPTEQDSVVAQRAIAQAMREVGLSTDEAAAFDRAWSGELYGLEQGRKVARRGKVERDVLLYALPASMLDPIAKLEFEPAPTSVKRFMLVRHEL